MKERFCVTYTSLYNFVHYMSSKKYSWTQFWLQFNPLNAELNPICHLLALLGAHHIFHVSRLRVKQHLIYSINYIEV